MTPASSVRALQCRKNHDTKLRKVVTSWIGKRGLRGWASTATGQQMGTVLFVESCHPKLQNNLVFGFCTKNFQKSETGITRYHYIKLQIMINHTKHRRMCSSKWKILEVEEDYVNMRLMPLSVKDMRKYGCVKTGNKMGAVPDSLLFLKLLISLTKLAWISGVSF